MRRLTRYCSILVFLLTSACGNLKTVEKPKKLIDEKTMEKILYDAVMMDVMQTFSELNPTFEEILGAPYLYKKYKIDSLQLVQSEEYYIKNPRIYYRIYSKVISQLQKSKDSIDTLFNNREKDTQ